MEDLVLENSEGMIAPFDFSMINDDDVTEEVTEEAVEQEEAEEVEEEVEAEQDEEAEEEEVEDSEEAVMTDEDGEEVDYENYEISLPTGEEVKLAELVQGYKDSAALEAERQEFMTLKSEFEEKSKNVAELMELAIIESQQSIDSYDDFDWAEEADKDPQNYAQHMQFFQHHKRRLKEIKAAYQEKKTAEENELKLATLQKARDASAQLVRDLPGWGDKMYQELCQYAVESGFDKDYVLESVSPAFFKMLHKMKAVEKGAQKVTAKVKKVGAPKKVIKKQASKPTPSKEAEREAQMQKAMKSGNPADMFQFLVD